MDVQTCPLLSCAKGTRHGFFTRRGGVSSALYESLNVGLGSNDLSENVHENRRRVQTTLGARDLRTLYQVHSASAVIVEAPWEDGPPEADAMVTNKPGIALGILTADCAPVLFADPMAGVVGAAHCGWKGTVSGIIEATLSQMEKLGAQRANILASIGPCIAQNSYEVGEDLRTAFTKQDATLTRFFAPGAQPTKWQFDLKGAVDAMLHQSGLSNIGHIAHDTYSDEARYFSYRRATHRNENDYGRQISAIMLT